MRGASNATGFACRLTNSSALAWHLDGQFQFDPDPAHASEVEVRFVVGGPTQTKVEVEHRGFGRHDADANAVLGSVDS